MTTISVAVNLQDFGPDATLIKLYKVLAAVSDVGIDTALSMLTVPKTPETFSRKKPLKEPECKPEKAPEKTLNLPSSECVKELWSDLLVPYCDCGECHTKLATQSPVPWHGRFMSVPSGGPILAANEGSPVQPGISHLRLTNATAAPMLVGALCSGVQGSIERDLRAHGSLHIRGWVRPVTIPERLAKSELSKAKIEQAHVRTAGVKHRAALAQDRQVRQNLQKRELLEVELEEISIELEPLLAQLKDYEDKNATHALDDRRRERHRQVAREVEALMKKQRVLNVKMRNYQRASPAKPHDSHAVANWRRGPE